MSRKRKPKSWIRNAATAIGYAGGGILLCLTGIAGSSRSIGAFFILLPIPAALLIVSFLLFRKAKKDEQARIAEEMACFNQTSDVEAQTIQDNPQPDWDDDSGEIHTVIHQYNQTAEDGWQQNKALYGSHVNTSKTSQIKGNQVGLVYQTDDYRKVLPGYIIGTILLLAASIVLLILVPVIGVFFSIFSIIWIVGLWKKAPIKKWKNQAQKLKDEKQNPSA
ncbi:MAG: hypothetical protein Q4C57_05580 [Bacillota bacterium]|nr:hypothetical protein [Bacillota bacterium]